MKKIILGLILIILNSVAVAQTPNRGGMIPNNPSVGLSSVIPVPGTSASPLNTVLGRIASVIDFGGVCDGVTNVATAVNAAKTAGLKSIRLPANCLYMPTANTTPSNFEVVGDNWETSVVSVAARATDDITLASKSILRNVAVISKFCDQTAPPAATQKTCPIGYAVNNSNNSNGFYAYPYQSFWAVSGPTITGPTGVSSTDLPNIDSTVFGAGSDAIYAQTGSGGSGLYPAAGASGVRIVTQGAGDYGILLLNGYNDPTTTDAHTGISINDYSNNSGALIGSQRISRIGDGTNVSQSLVIDDTNAAAATNTSSFIQLNAANQPSGNIVNLYQATTAFSGDFLHVNAGNNSGTFTGNFANYGIAGTSKYVVNSAGSIGSAGTLTVNGLSPSVTFAGTPTTSINTTTNVPSIMASRFTNDATGEAIGCLKSRNTTPGSHTIVQSGDTGCHVFNYMDDGTNYLQSGGFYWSVVGTPAAGDVRTQFDVVVRGASGEIDGLLINGNAGTLSTNGHKFTDTSGNLFATSVTDATTSTSGALQISGGASIAKRFWIPAISASAGLQAAVLCQSSGGEMIADSVACLGSGSQFKNILGPMENGALNKLKNLPIDRWEYKVEGNFASNDWTRERIGPIAQDVAAMDPRLAGYDKEGSLRTFSPDQLLAFTIKAIQEHVSKTETEYATLKSENDNLKACNDNWKCRLFGIK